jgi:hypothetical protein
MKLRKLLLAGSVLAMSTAMPAHASIVDNPHFKVLGLVIVWGADASGTAPVVSDFVIDTAAGAGDADLIATDVHTVVTGSLAPTPDSVSTAGGSPFDVTDGTSTLFSTDTNSDGILNASDSFTAFAIDANTDVGMSDAVYASSFYVASNTAFAINATASLDSAVNFALDDVSYDLSVTQTGNDGLAFGANAQFPHTGGATGGVVAAVDSLDDMTASTNVFTGNQRTAATPGSIASQSVRFDAEYSLGGTAGYDLSMGAGEIEASVVYTVYVP